MAVKIAVNTWLFALRFTDERVALLDSVRGLRGTAEEQRAAVEFLKGCIDTTADLECGLLNCGSWPITCGPSTSMPNERRGGQPGAGRGAGGRAAARRAAPQRLRPHRDHRGLPPRRGLAFLKALFAE